MWRSLLKTQISTLALTPHKWLYLWSDCLFFRHQCHCSCETSFMVSSCYLVTKLTSNISTAGALLDLLLHLLLFGLPCRFTQIHLAGHCRTFYSIYFCLALLNFFFFFSFTPFETLHFKVQIYFSYLWASK